MEEGEKEENDRKGEENGQKKEENGQKQSENSQGCSKCNGTVAANRTPDEIVVINVAGLKFKTKRSTLKRYPNTLLGKLHLPQRYKVVFVIGYR